MRIKVLALALSVLTWPSLASAQETAEKTPAENPAAKLATDLAVKKGLDWITRQQCVNCHFSVPEHPKIQGLAFSSDGKLLAAEFLDRLHRGSDQQCSTCHGGKAFDPCSRGADKKEQVTYLGVSLAPVPLVVRRHVKLPADMGLLVETVDAGSPAQTAGLKQHDLLLKIDEQLLINPAQFTVLIRTFAADSEVRLSAIQQNEPRTLTARLAQREIAASPAQAGVVTSLAAFDHDFAHPHRLWTADLNGQIVTRWIAGNPAPEKPAAEAPPARRMKTITYLGVHTAPPSEALAKQLRLAPGLGLMIESVEENTAAAKAGLKPYDILQKIDEQLLANSEQFTVLIRARKPGDEVQLTLIRDGKRQVVSVALGQHETEIAADEPFDENVARFVNVTPQRINWKYATGVGAFWESARAADASAESVPDAEFVRRAYLDLMGIVPRPEEVKAFLDDARPDKRKRFIDDLLARPEAISRSSGSTAVQWNDAQHALSLVSKDVGRHLLAKDAAGKTLFDGPINTEAQRKALPGEIAEKLAVMLKSESGRETKAASAQELLERVLPQVELAEIPLQRAFEQLRKQTGANLVVNWKAIKQAGVNADEPISLTLRDVRLSTALNTILSLAGDGKVGLGYTIEGEVILVSVKVK